jgi:hypothetical protein
MTINYGSASIWIIEWTQDYAGLFLRFVLYPPFIMRLSLPRRVPRASGASLRRGHHRGPPLPARQEFYPSGHQAHQPAGVWGPGQIGGLRLLHDAARRRGNVRCVCAMCCCVLYVYIALELVMGTNRLMCADMHTSGVPLSLS